MLVWASKDGKFGYSKLSFGQDECLDRETGQDGRRGLYTGYGYHSSGGRRQYARSDSRTTCGGRLDFALSAGFYLDSTSGFASGAEKQGAGAEADTVCRVCCSCCIYIDGGFPLSVTAKRNVPLLLARNHRTVSTLRLENIRNRLSPHFIFNVLNREMVERNVEEKQELSSLVKLMRRNLELVEQLCVTLAEELDFVKTYINLERRSLGPDFHSELKIEKDVQPEQIRIPSMMIQIPVENAVKHALREKEGERNLWVSVCRRGNGICIKITDNGGGYRPDSRNRGTGTGMKVIMQTIRILNNKNKEAIDVLVHNVSLQSGEMGCEVTFWLPDNYDYGI